MKSLTFLLTTGLAFAALAACIVPPSMYDQYWQKDGRYRTEELDSSADPEAFVPVPEEDKPAEKPAKAPLYAWDGGVVDGSPQGVSQAEEAPRGLEAPAPGRTHIIELYQQVLDERDGLAEEVELLRKSLEQTTIALEEETRKSNDLSARVSSLEVGHRELMEDNQAIAARLVQAQIRRLEAEKMLLETRIEMEKQKEAEAAQAAAAARAPAGKTPTKPKAEKAVAKDDHGDGGHE
jgi:hypothetical protein